MKKPADPSHGPAPAPAECCHSLQCIMPPHMVEAIKMRGNPAQRKMAADIEAQAALARLERQAAAPATAFRGAPLAARGARAVVKREVCDAKNGMGLPGDRVWKEGDAASKEKEVKEAYEGAADTYNLYFDVYRRNSLDGKGLLLLSSVHVRKNFNNAFWDGQQMAYGDGDGKIFTPLTASLSVIGHELSHGVVQFSGGLVYKDQSGALNESFADVFGALTVQYKKKQAARDADWLIGDGILGPSVKGVALRSMREPGNAYDDKLLGKDPQPFHMDEYVNTSSDNGGVHINSGIPNHAFYLLAQYLGGNAWEKAGHIWYDTLQAINNPHATFADWAELTVDKARQRFGAGSRELLFTRRAWKLVGLHV